MFERWSFYTLQKFFIYILISSLTGPDFENLIQKHSNGLKETLQFYNMYIMI